MGNSRSTRRKLSQLTRRKRSRQRIVLLAAGVVVISGGIAVTANAKQGTPAKADKPCTLKPNPHVPDESEDRSCFSVDASLDRALGVGETATIRFTVTAQRTARGVRVEADLPANLTWVTPPAGLAGSTRDDGSPVTGGKLNRAGADAKFKAGEVRTYEGKVTANAPGPVEIRVRAGQPALSEVPGEDQVFLNVGAAGQPSTFGIAASTESGTADTAEPVDSGATPYREPQTVPADGQAAPSSDDAVPAPRTATAAPTAAAAADTCVTGIWTYVDNAGKTRPVANASVQAWDSDTGNAHDLLASGVTGANGSYKLCFSNMDGPNPGQDVYVKMFTVNSRWKVQKTDTTSSYSFSTKTVGNVATGSTTNLGTTKPSDKTLMRALQAFDVGNDMWKWVPGSTCWDSLDSTCRQLVVNWAPDSTKGNYYSLQLNQLFLKADGPDSRHTVAHEMTHALMDDVYDDNYPEFPNCNPHSVTRKSSTGCAWTEGFAEWVPAAVFNDPYYRWPSGSSINLETPTKDSANWDDGDTVEGRIAGALIDIADSANEGNDIYGEGDPGSIWQTFLKHRSGTFREFWDQRKADGYNTAWTGALKSVYQNSIDYR